MNPRVQLYSLIHHYLTGDSSLEDLERELVPLLPYFAPLASVDPAARLAVELDALIVDVGLGEATEANLQALLQSLPTSSPTVQLEFGGSAVVADSVSASSHRMFVSSVLFRPARALP
jgi:hypothetical protein